jgi:RNA polymerase sigma-70 factor (ECF subfamily)
MNKALLDSPLGNKETAALYALMLFNSARFKSRFGPSGEILDLENQDRALWNKELILMANNFFHQSQSDAISTYHLEASIAWLHCSATSFNSTDWDMITQLYAQLLRDNPNPFIELNYTIALYYSGQKNKAFSLLNELERQSFLNQYSVLNSTLGKFHHLESNDVIAKEYLLKALQQTSFVEEKKFIQKMIDNLSKADL